MKRILGCFLLFITLSIFTSCSKPQLQSVKTNPYSGRALSIGIIGEVPEVHDQAYATGIIFYNDNLKSWSYGLYNDIENEANIKDVYSRIFETISKNRR